jgi:maltose-binding protein MalE
MDGEKRTGVTVRTDIQEYGDFRTNFNTRTPGGNTPDAFQNVVAFLRKW